MSDCRICVFDSGAIDKRLDGIVQKNQKNRLVYSCLISTSLNSDALLYFFYIFQKRKNHFNFALTHGFTSLSETAGDFIIDCFLFKFCLWNTLTRSCSTYAMFEIGYYCFKLNILNLYLSC